MNGRVHHYDAEAGEYPMLKKKTQETKTHATK
jgi:hypothetical protein